MDIGCSLLTSGQIEITAAWRPGADEYRVVILGEDTGEAIDALPETCLDATYAENIADLFVDHRLRQAEARDLATDHAAAARLRIVKDDLIAERRKVAGDGQRCRSGAEE